MGEYGALRVKEAPSSWKGNFILLVGAVIEVSKALHRIADALGPKPAGTGAEGPLNQTDPSPNVSEVG